MYIFILLFPQKKNFFLFFSQIATCVYIQGPRECHTSYYQVNNKPYSKRIPISILYVRSPYHQPSKNGNPPPPSFMRYVGFASCIISFIHTCTVRLLRACIKLKWLYGCSIAYVNAKLHMTKGVVNWIMERFFFFCYIFIKCRANNNN